MTAIPRTNEASLQRLFIIAATIGRYGNSPSEGYLLNPTVYKVGAEPELYTIEYNDTAIDVTEEIIKGIALIKHTDNGETGIETPEAGAEFQIYLKSAGSYEAAKESERDVLVCDTNGFCQSKDLPYGI